MSKRVSFPTFESKDGIYPDLCVKTFSEEHIWFRIFNDARCSTRFLTSHFRSRILNKFDYKVKDMNFDAKDELRCDVSFFKCKRVVLNQFNRKFNYGIMRNINQLSLLKLILNLKTKKRESSGTKLTRKEKTIMFNKCKEQRHNTITSLNVSSILYLIVFNLIHLFLMSSSL